jgi:8-oxo-dGTP diphosphatase
MNNVFYVINMMSKKQFDKLLKMLPLVVVDGILFKDGAVLMVKRKYKPYKGYWALPGGFVEYKERLEDAIVRETKEESGLDVCVKELIGVYSNPDRDPRGHIISICFLLEFIGGKIKTSRETSDAGFFKKLPEKIGADYRKMIMDAKKLLKDKNQRNS